jgi:hypothetical protein
MRKLDCRASFPCRSDTLPRVAFPHCWIVRKMSIIVIVHPCFVFLGCHTYPFTKTFFREVFFGDFCETP